MLMSPNRETGLARASRPRRGPSHVWDVRHDSSNPHMELTMRIWFQRRLQHFPCRIWFTRLHELLRRMTRRRPRPNIRVNR